MSNSLTENQKVLIIHLATVLNEVPRAKRGAIATSVGYLLKAENLRLDEHEYLLLERPLKRAMEQTGSRLTRDFKEEHLVYVSEDGDNVGASPALKTSYVGLAEMTGLSLTSLEIYRYQRRHRGRDGSRLVPVRGSKHPLYLHWFAGKAHEIEHWEKAAGEPMMTLTDWWKTAEANPKRVAPPGSEARRAY